MEDDRRSLTAGRLRGPAITLDLDGQPIRAHVGEPVALALFASGVRVLARSPKYHRPRGLFCGNGHCGSCQLRIDGKPNQRACMIPVREGLRCERQNAFPDPEIDLLRAADWLFPNGMDHHRLMTGSRLGNDLFVKLVRQMGGSGTLPDLPADDLPIAEDVAVDLCVVGAGPAGLAGALAVAEQRPQARILLLDDQAHPGGSWLAEPDGVARAETMAATVRAAGVRSEQHTAAIAFFPEDDAPEAGTARGGSFVQGLLAAVGPRGLLRITARRFLYATGAYDQNFPVPDNDRPGILAGRAVGRLAFEWGIHPGRRVVLLRKEKETPIYVSRLHQGLAACGIDVRIAEVGDRLRLDLEQDVLAVCALPAPASELPRQQGATVVFAPERGGFAVVAADDGRCAPDLFVAGDVTGYVGTERAAEAGARIGRQVAESL